VPRDALSRLFQRRGDAFWGALVFLCAFLVFRSAPLQQPGDSRYTMLLAENLLRYHDFDLERYGLPDPDYRLQTVNGHRYYVFPPGSSILSVPFVALMHLRGLSAVRSNGSFDIQAESTLEATLAPLLMSAFAVLAFCTARLLLPVPWSLAVACIATFGTQVFSTMSRSMWSDTWGTLLIGLSSAILLRSAIRSRPPRVALLGTLDAVAYVVRPTSSLVMLGTTAYLLVKRPKDAGRFVLVVAGWLSLLFGYSWFHFHKPLPDYYAASRLQFPDPIAALFGNLVSPSRGLLVYVPAVIGTAGLLLRYRRTVRFRSLTALGAFVMIAHLIMLSGFVHWWGGYSYGARLTASLVPWLVILSVIGLDAARTECATGWRSGDIVSLAMAGLLGLASIAMNAIGAFSTEAQDWNVIPDDIDRNPSRLWSWRHPQFLAPFQEPEGPFLELPQSGLRVGTSEAGRYLGHGWPSGEGEFRWTEGRGGSTVRFALPTPAPGALEIELRPYLCGRKLSSQRLVVTMNDRELGSLVLQSPELAAHRFVVPADVARPQNIIRLQAPDAASPSAMDGSSDRRRLGVAVRTIRWDAEPNARF
jgi:hypothetical protein